MDPVRIWFEFGFKSDRVGRYTPGLGTSGGCRTMQAAFGAAVGRRIRTAELAGSSSIWLFCRLGESEKPGNPQKQTTA